MKKYLCCVAGDLKRAVFSHAFLISAAAAFALCFSIVGYRNGDGGERTVLDILMQGRGSAPLGLSVSGLIKVSNYMVTFLPIIAALPFVTTFCAERQTGNMRFQISRVGRMPYYFAKFTAALLSGGMAVLAGYLLYTAALCAFFPVGGIGGVARGLCGVALYGMASVTPVFFFTSFIKNKYIACCLPFILMHFYSTILMMLQNYFAGKMDYDAALAVMSFYPNSVAGLSGAVSLRGIVIQAAQAALSLAGFVLVMNRRFDYGE